MIFALVGNKVDIADKREVKTEEAQALAKQKDFIFQEVSAKSGINMNNLFYKDIFDKIITKFKLGGQMVEDPDQCIYKL